jgi:predicted 3-demethylubiquinone-9 3-methyltransferase (glyoxalase superfamily)
MQKITPFLWFNGEAEEAAKFYTSIFRNSRINKVARMGDGGPGVAGRVLTVAFELEGREFIALNGGPQFSFTEAISFVVNSEPQAEIDEIWAKLTAGGHESRCGWLKDRFGLSWQVVPPTISQLLSSDDPARAGRVMQELMKMSKIDIGRLQDAYDG